MKNDLSTVVTLHNIDDEDFEFSYNASEGNMPYVIPMGEVARYPKFLADHALKHLIDKILTKRKTKTSNERARLDIANQVVIGEESLRGEPRKSDVEKLRMDVDELNKVSNLDAILARRKAEKEAEALKTEDAPKLPEAKVEEKKVGETFDGLEKKAMPTKAQLLEYASQQGLVMDEPNKEGKTLTEIYSKMKVSELITELNYPIDEE